MHIQKVQMRIILEGPIGSGKTTLGDALSNITSVPLYRPFRKPGTHITSQQSAIIRQHLGLVINGWEEDIYVADMLSAINADVILDRSMLSALAYNWASEHALDATQRALVLRLWAQRIADAKAVLVLVSAKPETRRQRAGDRFTDWEGGALADAITELVKLGMGIPIWQVWTDANAPVQLALDIARRMTFGWHSDLVETVQGPAALRSMTGETVIYDG